MTESNFRFKKTEKSYQTNLLTYLKYLTTSLHVSGLLD